MTTTETEVSKWFFYLCQFSILAFGLLGGVFLAFSDFLMRALGNTSTTSGIEAMQVINREVFRYVFMALFLGMAPVSLVISGYALMNLSGPSAVLLVLSAAIYLVAAFGTTVIFNVPLNEALASRDIESESTNVFWTATYLPHWTFWNSVRTASCALASALLLFGLLRIAEARPLKVAQPSHVTPISEAAQPSHITR